nr:diacylglycerol kinase family protein [uncultured Acetobacterium sp.]
MEVLKTNVLPMRIKLIFNPGSGSNDDSPQQMLTVIKEMQAWKFVPEIYLIEPDCNLREVVEEAIAQGIDLFVVCGGDGTVTAVTKAIVGSTATLGIVPTGTQNNVALSLGIPTDIPAAIAILRQGQSLKIDLGMVTCNNVSTPFIELCSVGLFSTLFPSGDDIQHGNIARIGDFLGILTTSPPSEIHLILDDNREISELGHAALISNMPYIGRHYKVGALDAYHDGLLDVLFFSDLSKLDLIAYILNGVGTDSQEDPRIKHYRVREVVIDTEPSMSVMADGISLGEGSVRIEVQRQALTVMVGSTESNEGQ